MSIHREVQDFKRVNGNGGYSQRDMLMYMCSKIDKLEEGQEDIKITLGEDGQRFKWMKRAGVVYASFTTACITGLFYIFLTYVMSK